jgi:hypothetical protein
MSRVTATRRAGNELLVPAVGQRFGHYELLALEGHDDLGALYRARDVRLGRTVALRVVRPEVADDPIVRARLNREVTVLAALEHPNVPPVYEADEYDGRIYIASRWVEGVDLGTLVAQAGPLEPRRAVRVINQVAWALQAAHSVGIMNRVVKPSSVLVTATDQAYLTDFALARRSTDPTGLTAEEQLVGDLDHLAPEYLAGQKTDVRVDIYGLGSVLFEALTGEVPFPGPGSAAKMYARTSSEPPSLRERRPDVPERLDAVVRRALANDPDQRQQSAAEFAVEAAGAVDLSPPPWAGGTGSNARAAAARPAASPAARPAAPPAAPPAAQPAAPPAARPPGAAALPSPAQPPPAPAAGPVADGDGYHAAVYYRGGRRLHPRHLRRRNSGGGHRWVPWAVAVVIFLGAAIALVVALTAR